MAIMMQDRRSRPPGSLLAQTTARLKGRPKRSTETEGWSLQGVTYLSLNTGSYLLVHCRRCKRCHRLPTRPLWTSSFPLLLSPHCEELTQEALYR